MNKNLNKIILSSIMTLSVCGSVMTVLAEEPTEETPAAENTEEASSNEATAIREINPNMLRGANGFSDEALAVSASAIDLQDLAVYLGSRPEVAQISGMYRVTWDGESTQEEGKIYTLNIEPILQDMHMYSFPFGEYYEGKTATLICTVGDVFEEGTKVKVVHTKDGAVVDSLETEVTDGRVVINNTKGFSTFTITPVEEEKTPDAEPVPDEKPAPAPTEPDTADTNGRKPATNTGVK